MRIIAAATLAGIIFVVGFSAGAMTQHAADIATVRSELAAGFAAKANLGHPLPIE